MTTVREGGCLCGEVRYRIDGAAEPADVSYCHCRMCQRASGAPVVAWFTVPSGSLAWTKGSPRPHRSSERAGRLFCPDCGTQLVFRSLDQPDRLDVTIASLDEPGSVAPDHHIWVSSRLPWFDTADALPRHAEGREVGGGPEAAHEAAPRPAPELVPGPEPASGPAIGEEEARDGGPVGAGV